MGYWSDDMEWIENDQDEPEVGISWKTLIEKLQEMPEEALTSQVTIVDDVGCEIFGAEVKFNETHGIYIKGE